MGNSKSKAKAKKEAANAAAAAAAAAQAQAQVNRQEGEDEVKALQIEYPAGAKMTGRRGRRGSVSAEADPTNRKHVKVIIPKSEAAMERIAKAVSESFLFGSCDDEERKEIFDAMKEVKVVAGEDVIKYGADGDYFYIVDKGDYEVKRKKPGVWEFHTVHTYHDSGSFGELALMYNCPRGATITALTDGTLWGLDRSTFRHIIITSASQKRKKYEKFLQTVEVFSPLDRSERQNVADALEPQLFKDGQTVMKEGDHGESFYVIEQGTCVVTQQLDGEDVEVGRLTRGHYFGERALLTDENRAATVRALGDVKLGVMARGAFNRLLGPCKEVMQAHLETYKTAEQILKEEDAAQE